ncbi:MAG: restriction endonuclease subunit S [Thiobacillus sp.]|nr:hypothetical protein [Thiobacillus sp.]MBC2741200.1 restriction endonuclease subunit S [Thiobacillus sp.]MBC2761438.1 restriction endonuclease subunit S [Thiobacillus sp.]
MGELFQLEKGRIGIKAATPGFFPLVTTGEEYLSHIEPHFFGDSICIPLISATGHGHASLKRLHHIEGEFAVGSILCACVNSSPDRVVARYAYYYLSACKDSVLIPLMQGTANMSMKVSDIAGVGIPLPPLTEQQAIVSRLDTLADKARQVNEHLDSIERDADRLLAVRFRDAIVDAPLRPMAEVAPLVRREIAIDPQASYTELGVRSFFKGTFQRRTMEGTDYSWQNLFSVKTGDLIFSNIMAWEQAIAIAKPEDDGCVGNHRMLTCEVNADAAVASFLYYYFTTAEGFAKIDAASPGTAARNKTLKAQDLMAIVVPVPSDSTQRTFDALQAKVAALKARHATIRQANDALIPATLERVFN